MEDNECIICTDTNVINGKKFCFACVPTCVYRKQVSKEEFESYLKIYYGGNSQLPTNEFVGLPLT